MSAVYSCGRVLTETLSGLPLHLYKRESSNSEEQSKNCENLDTDGNEGEISIESDDNNEYIVTGEKVDVLIEESGKNKTILVNYIPNSMKIPPLAKSLIGCRVGDEVEFKGKTYLIEAIQK